MLNMRLKGRLAALVAVTVFAVTVITSAVLIVNDSILRKNQFAQRLSVSMVQMSQLMADYQYAAIRDSGTIALDYLFPSVFQESADGAGSSSESYLQSLLREKDLDVISIYSAEGKLLGSAVSGRQFYSDKPVKFRIDGSDQFYFDTDEQGFLNILYVTPVKMEGKTLGYLKTCKCIDTDFADSLKRLSGAEFEYIAADKKRVAEAVEEIWGSGAGEAVLFPFTDIGRGDIYYSAGAFHALQSWDFGNGTVVVFRYSISGQAYPFTAANIALLVTAVFVLLMLVLVPLWRQTFSVDVLGPLDRLTELAQKVKSGDYSQETGRLGRRDELAELEESFISMIEAVKGREEQLDELNRSLQSRVDEETEKRIKNEKLMLEQRKFADMGQMINAIAHQWRQPLNNLSLIVQYVCESVENDEINKEDITRNKGIALQLINHMSKTIDDFRNFFSQSKRMTDYDLVRAVCDVVNMIKPQFRNHRIRLNLYCQCKDRSYECRDDIAEPDCGMRWNIVHGMPGEFKQALLNILQNSAEAIESSISAGRSDDGVIDIYIVCYDENVRLIVKDSGTGIPDEIVDKIFDPYFTTKKGRNGTGIGLYMTRAAIVDNLNGSIRAYNHSYGAVVEMVIPKKGGSGGSL